MAKVVVSKLMYCFLSSAFGFVILTLLSLFQKLAIGSDPFVLKGYIVPGSVGILVGGFIGMMLYNNIQLIKKLKDINSSLDNQVRERTEELNKKNEILNRIANTDALTSLSNRRHFDSLLKYECKRLTRVSSSLVLILCDIDYFKLFNDTYGHQAGDACLKQVASALVSLENRDSDIVARYGGEEFAIVLPNTQLENGIELAEKIRNAIKNLNIPNINAPENKIITMTFGVAAILSNSCYEEGANILISQADEALYIGKHNGRDRVVASNLKT